MEYVFRNNDFEPVRGDDMDIRHCGHTVLGTLRHTHEELYKPEHGYGLL